MQIKWQKLLSREGVDLTTISSGIGPVFYSLIWEFTKVRKELFFTYFKDKNFTHYIAINPQALGLYIYKKLFNSPQKIKKHYAGGKVLLKKIQKTAKIWQERLTAKSSNKLFLRALNDLKHYADAVNRIYNITSWFAIEAWQNDFEKILSAMIQRNNLSNQQEQIIASVYKPWRKTAIAEIRDKIKKGVEIKKLVAEYQFLRSWSVVWYKPIDQSWVKNLGQGSSDAKQVKILSIPKLVNLLKPDSKERHYLELAPYLIFFKDWRDDVRRKNVYYWTFFFHLVAQKFNIEYSDLGYLSLEEIEGCLKLNQLNRAVIEKRKVNPCIVTADAPHLRMKIIDQNLPQKYLTIVKEVKTKASELIIKGLVVQKGKVRGRVKIMKSYHDLKDIKAGDILVANTTHPNYIPAMQKAAAFVTNEGGMVCHAAIVAREMKKPCIVGTKIATQVLKDGDLVEVNASKGIVMVIK